MSLYTYTIVFEAENDEEAKDLVWGGMNGISHQFDPVDSERLTDGKGNELA